MRIDIITLFPSMFKGVFDESMMKIARREGVVDIRVHDLRDWTCDRHRTADDKPYGGGPGMVMKIEPVDKALKDLKNKSAKNTVVILLTPQGDRFDVREAKKLSFLDHMILICGHYEGFDERIRSLVDREISIGDYVLTCGELPAMVLCDAVIRLIPGVLGDKNCLEEESFENDMLEYPQYTRPAVYNDMRVPSVLLCGDPKKIRVWQEEQAEKRTRTRRPDLLEREREELYEETDS
ncbi:MAG: tRNA (guanosine(37)-N1)-methyltransferase TrmD [Candidatus Omnitrophica bacterium]|nr:tRNA (guanosine(37)-N1)-methyltransferase TrmD [Candidatus Omnitrophota bacterium]